LRWKPAAGRKTKRESEGRLNMIKYFLCRFENKTMKPSKIVCKRGIGEEKE
jgi:hypothetical protein